MRLGQVGGLPSTAGYTVGLSKLQQKLPTLRAAEMRLARKERKTREPSGKKNGACSPVVTSELCQAKNLDQGPSRFHHWASSLFLCGALRSEMGGDEEMGCFDRSASALVQYNGYYVGEQPCAVKAEKLALEMGLPPPASDLKTYLCQMSSKASCPGASCPHHLRNKERKTSNRGY